MSLHQKKITWFPFEYVLERWDPSPWSPLGMRGNDQLSCDFLWSSSKQRHFLKRHWHWDYTPAYRASALRASGKKVYSTLSIELTFKRGETTLAMCAKQCVWDLCGRSSPHVYRKGVVRQELCSSDSLQWYRDQRLQHHVGTSWKCKWSIPAPRLP